MGVRGLRGFSTISPPVGGDSYIVVAAADTPSKLKSRADYVCDGTSTTGGDEEEINAALAVADVVILCPGTYWVSGPIIMGSNKSLIGGGLGCTIKLKNYYNDSLAIITNSDYTNGNSNILISNIHIDGNRENQGAYFHEGIYFEKVSNSKITYCRIEKLTSFSIYLFSSSNNTISGSMIGNGENGIRMEEYCDNNVIIGNMISGNDDYGIYIFYSNNNVITNNIVSGNGEDGILIDFANNNVIIGNTISGNEAFGITIYSGSNNVIANNCINNNSNYGIYMYYGDNNVIIGNMISGNGDEGMYIRSGINNTIASNTISGNGEDGILMSFSDNNVIIGNMISGNGTSSINEYCGIAIFDSDYNLISGNICRHGDYQKYGIRIADSYCNYNMVEGNNLYASGLTGDLYDAGTNTRKRDNLGNTGAWLTDV